MYPGDPGPPGSDCAGIVMAVGAWLRACHVSGSGFRIHGPPRPHWASCSIGFPNPASDSTQAGSRFSTGTPRSGATLPLHVGWKGSEVNVSRPVSVPWVSLASSFLQCAQTFWGARHARRAPAPLTSLELRVSRLARGASAGLRVHLKGAEPRVPISGSSAIGGRRAPGIRRPHPSLRGSGARHITYPPNHMLPPAPPPHIM